MRVKIRNKSKKDISDILKFVEVMVVDKNIKVDFIHPEKDGWTELELIFR